MVWFLAAIASSAIFAITYLIDSFFVNRVLKAISFIFYVAMLKAVVGLSALLVMGKALSWDLMQLFILIGIFELAYLIPYYKSLEIDDTSIVASLFTLGKIFLPILAYFIVDEQLSVVQYLGFFLVVFASMMVTKQKGKLKFDQGFYLMIFSAFASSLQVVVYKKIFTMTDVITGLSGSFAFLSIPLLFLLWVPSQRRHIIGELKIAKKYTWMIIAGVIISICAWLCGFVAIAAKEVTIVSAILTTIPFFVLVYTLLLQRIFPKWFHEHVDRASLAKKGIWFSVMIIGVIVIM